ncbi:MAG: HAMP domain-containing sensor histidine kinase, partial [Acidobacteria bacterium]|nr:HAMP domain-containing sensor histidine kinase [Acidobacteriota bacterium]
PLPGALPKTGLSHEPKRHNANKCRDSNAHLNTKVAQQDEKDEKGRKGRDEKGTEPFKPDFSRIESGHRDYQPIRCSVKDIMQNVLADYREPVAAAGFDLEVEIEDNLPPILADQNAISQAILNLLDNAVKYSPDEKFIAVRVSRRETGIAIEVEDRGIGIPPSEQSRIFEKFHRVGNPLTPVTRGSGLGLALAKHTVEAHSDRIDVNSKVGQGSRFTIVLPIAEAEAKPSVGGQVVLPHLGG